jgi:hypothetical protein
MSVITLQNATDVDMLKPIEKLLVTNYIEEINNKMISNGVFK